MDSKSVVQEVHKELLAVVQRGQEQVRKGQDRVRKSQEQARKSRDAVVSVVRAGSELAKAVRPARPTLPPVRIPSPAAMRAHAQELAGQAITAQRDLAARAKQAAGPVAGRVLTTQRELAEKARQAGLEHAAAAQRSLAGRVIEVAKAATPIVAEGRTRLNQLVSALQPGQPATGAVAQHVAAPSAGTAEPEVPAAAQPAAAQPAAAQPAAPESESAAQPRTSTVKAGTAKTSTTKASAAKTSTAKTSTAKTSTARASAAKTSTAKASARRSAADKPRSTPK